MSNAFTESVKPTELESNPVQRRTLKTRAVYYLSKREYSRAELAKKLTQPTYQARQEAFTQRTELPEVPSAEVIDEVLDDLQRQGFLNDTRFAHSFIKQHSTKHGVARILANLAQHQLDATTTAQLAAQLKDSELERCYTVWAKRFEPINKENRAYAETQAAINKQTRFLMQRGFNNDAVRKVLNGWQPDNDSDTDLN